MKSLNYRLKRKLNEVFVVEPNDLGIVFLTNWYKRITAYFKTAPFLIVIPLSFLVAIFLYLIFGYLVVRLVSLLQYGF